MMDHFIHEDNESSDNAYHKGIRKREKEPVNMMDDDEFTKKEI